MKAPSQEVLDASSVLGWVVGNNFVNEANKPFEYEKHRFLIDYMADDARVKCTIKCAQIGLTVAEIVCNIHDIIYKNLDVIHTLHNSDVLNGFVFPKVNPIISLNPKIAQMLSRDSESLKQFGDHFYYIRGANSMSQAVSITADKLCVDEVDKSDQNVVETFESRLSHSEHKIMRYFSNPTGIGFGIDKLWRRSDQRHWMVKCSHCGHRSFMDFERTDLKNHYVDIDKAIYACGKCSREINDAARINGEWVATVKGREMHGYWFSQLMAPWISAKEVMFAYETKTTEYFHNFILGKAYTPTTLIVGRENILRACQPAQIPKRQVAIGVDVGVKKYWVAATPDGIFDYGMTESWEDIEKLKIMYDATMVIDAAPDLTTPPALMNKYRGQVFICYYKQDTQNAGAIRFKEGKDFGVVMADRTKLIDIVATEINDGRLKFRLPGKDMETYITHWSNTARIVETTDKGIERGVWTKDPSKPEHLVHATAYMRIALSRTLGTGGAMNFAEPKTGASKPKADYVSPAGLLTFNLTEAIEEAMES